MYSTYLKCDIEVPTQDMTSSGEEVTIIPHAFLEDLLLNSEMTQNLNVVTHFTTVPTNEAGHYVFLCSISDNQGRRAEGIGESLPATLDTEIAKNYPALMAYKRSFDDAAIKYFGFSGKVYTDQQCKADTSLEGAAKPTDFQAAPLDDEVPDETFSDDTPTAAAPTPMPKPAATSKNKKASNKNNTASAFAAPPLEEDTEEEADKEETSVEEYGSPLGAPPLDDEDDDEEMQMDADVALDDERFDTPVTYGRLQNIKPPLSIRDAYEKYPESVRWIANDMAAYTDDQRKHKQWCAEYVALKEKGNE